MRRRTLEIWTDCCNGSQVVAVKVADLFFQLTVNVLPFCLPCPQVDKVTADVQ